MAMTFSRRWMYSHRVSSITRALFSDGMAGKSKVSSPLHRGEAGCADPPLHHALVTVDELQFRLPPQVPWMAHPLGSALGPIFPYSLRKLGLCRDCGATAIPAQNGVRRAPSDTVFTTGCGRLRGGDETKRVACIYTAQWPVGRWSTSRNQTPSITTTDY